MNSIKTLTKWLFLVCSFFCGENLLAMMTLRHIKMPLVPSEETKLLSDDSLRQMDFMIELQRKRRHFIHDFQPGNHNDVLFSFRPIIIVFDNLSSVNFIERHIGYSGSLDSTLLAGYEIKPGYSKHAVFNAAPLLCDGNIAFMVFEFQNSKERPEYLFIGIILEGNFHATPKIFITILPELNVENPGKIAIVEKELQPGSIDKQYFNMVRKFATANAKKPYTTQTLNCKQYLPKNHEIDGTNWGIISYYT